MSDETRWTCEACGCNTNTSTDTSCSICGTSNSGPAVIRGRGALRAASWFARGLSRAQDFEEEEEEELWEEEEEEQAMDALAMEVSNMANRQRFLESVLSQQQRVEPAEVLRCATENAASYQPHWSNPAQMRLRSGSGIEVGEAERQNLAHVPMGAGEGRTIRADEPLPRENTGASNALQTRRRVFGFRVAFDHPTVETGGNMGGCYLIGVTTSSFTAYGEQNGLSQSPFFWGIEDSGHKYEGSRYSVPSRGRRSPSYCVDIRSDEAPLNDAGVLFGARDVITVVCDFDTRTLTFWRNETLLGTLVTSLPRGGNLYPVAVPFNCGVTVSLTGMANDPLPFLKTFATDWRKEQQERDAKVRKKLAKERSILIENGKPTPALIDVLKEIFGMYLKEGESVEKDHTMGVTSAARLWYRCGMKLAHLDSVLKEKSRKSLRFADFLEVLEKVIHDDKESSNDDSPPDSFRRLCEVGDKVELVEDYARFGDANGGPLYPGDRGIVVEIHRGPNGERRSVRVLHNGRRWWYQPQALLPEKSGLILSSSAWFIGRILRAHCFDRISLKSLSGKPVTAATCQVGDIVVPKKVSGDAESDSSVPYGLVVPEPSSPCLGTGTRHAVTASIEFCSSLFGKSVGVHAPPGLEIRKVRLSRLLHADWTDIDLYQCGGEEDEIANIESDGGLVMESDHPVSEKLKEDVSGLSRLDQSFIESVTKECKRSSDALASLFGAELPNAILTAIDVAERQMNTLEPREDLVDRIESIGTLISYIAEQLFSENKTSTEGSGENEVEENETRFDNEIHRNHDVLSGAIGQGGMFSLDNGTRRDGNHENFASSLEHRRSVLMSLMSRARRGGVLGELLERGNPGELNVGQLAPPLGPLRGGQPFIFGLDENAWEDADFAQVDNRHTENDSDLAGVPNMPRSVLDEIILCRGTSVTETKSSGSPVSTFAQHVAAGGFLNNDLDWVEASIEFHLKKGLPNAIQRSTTLVRVATDREGTPLLRLAIALGCSVDIIKHLISCGAHVGEAEVRQAASTDQASTLQTLLQHTSYREGIIDLSKCSERVRAVVARAKCRRAFLEKKMREAAETFMVSLVRRFVHIAMSLRLQSQSPRLDQCCRAITDILIGDVLLSSLQASQKAGDDLSTMSTEVSSTRMSLSQPVCQKYLDGVQGLFAYLPRNILGEALLKDAGTVTHLLLLIELYLYSKDMNDTSRGLSLLGTVVQRFPALKWCGLDRYGMQELVAFHESLASSRMLEISSKLVPRDGPNAAVVVCCPKGHTAVLHITRHSSFRCDLCGNGVERGCPMHGCRECDWDACESCTDKAESGIIKCMTIKKLAEECQKIFSEKVHSAENDEDLADFVKHLPRTDIKELDSLANGIVRRDPLAAETLRKMLNEPGRLTVHQFLTKVLPSLHVAFFGDEDDDGCFLLDSVHRNKKPRVRQEHSSLASFEARLNYCRDFVSIIVAENNGSSNLHNQTTTKSDGSLVIEQEYLGEVNDTDMDQSQSNSDLLERLGTSELFRILNQVLSVHENLSVSPSFIKKKTGIPIDQTTDLHALKQAIEIQLIPLCSDGEISDRELLVQAEPLISVDELKLHLLRCSGITMKDAPYLKFCSSLADANAIILERPFRHEPGSRRIAKVLSFDEWTGSHLIQYASGPARISGTNSVRITQQNSSELYGLEYEGECVRVILSMRDYVVLSRRRDSNRNERITEMEIDNCVHPKSQKGKDLLKLIGSRVESNYGSEIWINLTLVAYDTKSVDEDSFILVSDDGIVYTGVPTDSIRMSSSISNVDSRNSPSRRNREGRDIMNRAFPFLTARQRAEFSNGDSEASSLNSHIKPGALKRSWSAISLVDSLQPVVLDKSNDVVGPVVSLSSGACYNWKCSVGDSHFHLCCDKEDVEVPPILYVSFSIDPKMPGVDSSDSTVLSLLKLLYDRHGKYRSISLDEPCKLYFRIYTSSRDMSSDDLKIFSTLSKTTYDTTIELESSLKKQSHSRKSSVRSRSNENDIRVNDATTIVDGLDETCIQCMEVMSFMAKAVEDSSIPREGEKDCFHYIANKFLSKKLTEQLDDPITVVGGALPGWCLAGTTFAPRVFSYTARRLLLERAAFGVSRSALKQQESKINVGRLRQRMASLRARAVELVGEAFSSGAEDPTALQLQADELYGMEEALAARVRASFRAAKWQEHSLQVAKAAVRRDKLLQDAACAMERYANNPDACRRRLEVRFDGESGFDAASGDEAGVTRGFYADAAEALLSAENIAGVHCPLNCIPSPSVASIDKKHIADVETLQSEANKLPLWIPDMDATAQVVIPTPRADPRSGLGVYPRPLPSYHPQFSDVLDRFRLMGRLFAAAMRDGFLFPLPLSSSFLKLVRSGQQLEGENSTRASRMPPIDSFPSTADLPRPGFLGGEVYAAEMYICRALDRIDSIQPPLSRHDLTRRYEEVATDKNFARVAMGKTFDCSFNDYFQDRTFVDPLDPTQGEDAVPLCLNGHKKSVTIYNIREWVALAKEFILYDGAIAQALAFRQGVDDFFPGEYLSLFTPEELQRDVCGVGDNVDSWDDAAVRKLFKLDGGKGAAEALVAVAAIGGEGGAALSRRFGPSSPTINHLVMTLLEASPKERRQFLSFVTSVPIVTPGRIEVVPLVSPTGEFLPMRDPGCLPRANTCARRLYLPKFESYESFSQVLWAVVREESKFKGFYEWRGS